VSEHAPGRTIFRQEALRHAIGGDRFGELLDLRETRLGWAFRALLVAVGLTIVAGLVVPVPTPTTADRDGATSARPALTVLLPGVGRLVGTP
jgi:hypothetical protein